MLLTLLVLFMYRLLIFFVTRHCKLPLHFLEVIQNAIGEMRLKWLQYYKVIPDTFLVAMVFDPRCKLKGLESFLLAYFPLLEVDDDPNVMLLA